MIVPLLIPFIIILGLGAALLLADGWSMLRRCAIFCTGVVLCLGAEYFLFGELRARQRRTDLVNRCQQNLRMIHMAMELYHGSYEMYPDSLQRLVSSEYPITPRRLRCPRVIAVLACELAYGKNTDPEYVPTAELGSVMRMVSDERIDSMEIDYVYYPPVPASSEFRVVVEESKPNHSLGFSRSIIYRNALFFDGTMRCDVCMEQKSGSRQSRRAEPSAPADRPRRAGELER